MRSWFIGILVVFFELSNVQGQQAAQSPEVSYDGQKVATVELVANPKISTDSLQPLVQQKAGETYASAKVEATIVAPDFHSRTGSVFRHSGIPRRTTIPLPPPAAGG